MISNCGLCLRCNEMLLGRLHVNVGLCQAEFSRNGALVCRPHQLLDAASLRGGIRLPHVSEELTDVCSSTPRIGGRLPCLGVCLPSVGRNGPGIGYDFAQICFDATRIRHHFAHIRTRGPLVGSRVARVGVRFAGIGICLPVVGIDAARFGVKLRLAPSTTFLDNGIHRGSMPPTA